MLIIKDLHAGVKGKEILKGIDLHVRPGEIHAVMGPNGSGKSTMANVLAGREGYDVTRGEVIYRGADLLRMEPEVRACPTFTSCAWRSTPSGSTTSARRYPPRTSCGWSARR